MQKDEIFESMDRFKKSYSGLADATVKNYDLALNYFHTSAKEHGLFKLADVPEHIKSHEFALWLKRRGVKDGSIQYYINRVKQWLRDEGIPVEYTYKVSSDQKKEKRLKNRERWFSANDIHTILFEAEKEGGAVELAVNILLDTGMRIRELASMKLENIDGQVLFIDDSKTDPRFVFITSFTLGLLQAFLKLSSRQEMLEETDEPTLLFHGLSQPALQKRITRFLGQIGMKNGADGRGPHTFRHYHASYLYFVGKMPLDKIAIMLGDKPDVVFSTYIHLSDPEWMQNEVVSIIGKARW